MMKGTTMFDPVQIGRLVKNYWLLLDNYENNPDQVNKKMLENFLKKYPNIRDYNERGGYIGQPRNEDGWTP